MTPRGLVRAQGASPMVKWLILVAAFVVVYLREFRGNTFLASSLAAVDGQRYEQIQPKQVVDCPPQKEAHADPLQNKNDYVILYPRDPQRFTNTLVECLDDSKCHFLYHHIAKTAGTYLSSLLYPVFQNGDRYKSSRWCCHERLMEDFWKRPKHYCVEQKMSIFEVAGDNFEDALEACEALYAGEGEDSHRYVALVSLREPIQRTVSLIHQNCNGEIDWRSAEFQFFCRNCTYGDHSADFFQSYFNETNQGYLFVNNYLKARTGEDTVGHTPILVIDNSMVNNFVRGFNSSLSATNRPIVKTSWIRHNPEKLNNCNFKMQSSLFRTLRPANDIYLNIWNGIYV